jgi:predicted Zn-dependent protease
MNYVNAEKIRDIIKKYSTSDEFILFGRECDFTNIRFHENTINREFITNKNIEFYLKSFFGARSASVLINSIDEKVIAEKISFCEELAKKAPEDPEYICQMESADYSFYKNRESSFELPHALRILKNQFDIMREKNLKSYGVLKHYQFKNFIVNSRNICTSINSSEFDFNVTVKHEDSTGWAGQITKSFDMFEIDKLFERAANKAIVPRKGFDSPIGKRTVILEAPAMGELLLFLPTHLKEKDVDRDVSSFSGKLNTTVCSKDISLVSSIDEKYFLSPFSNEAVPARNIEIIKSGVLKELSRTRYYADKKNKKPNYFGNYILKGEREKEKSLESIISETENGILVTRFWYTRVVDPKRLVLTGMTRDGLYEIKDGSISGAINNLRFNQSLLNLMEDIEMYSEEQNAIYNFAAPNVRVKDFNFTSSTLF